MLQRTVLALAGLLLAGTVAAQAPARPQIQTTKVDGADGVYIFRNGNHQSMFVVTNDGVIATDPVAYGRPDGGRQYVEEIRKVTDKPIKYLIYSHHHYDHIAGGKAFKDAGATIVAHAKAKERLEKVADPFTPLPDELVPDSGGAGRWRGGLSTRMEVVAPMEASAFLTFDRAKFPPWGLYGGKDGMAGYGQIESPGQPVKTVNKAYTPIPQGTLVRAVNNGGGGWGDPLERDPQAVLEDVIDEYVSVAGAERDYGVVLTGSLEELTLAVDLVATEATRAARRTGA